MIASDAKVGMEVTLTGHSSTERYVILDRSPRTGCWWLQHAERGTFREASTDDMDLVCDPLDRAPVLEYTPRGDRTTARFVAGEFAVIQVAAKDVRVFHVPTRLRLPQTYPTITEAKKVCTSLKDVTGTTSEVAAQVKEILGL